MSSTRWPILLLSSVAVAAASGCGRDVCTDLRGTCVALEVAPRSGTIEATTLSLMIDRGELEAEFINATPRSPRDVRLPATLAVVFDSFTVETQVRLAAIAETPDARIFQGETMVGLRPGQHLSARVVLDELSGIPSDQDLSVDGGEGPDGDVPVDLAGTDAPPPDAGCPTGMIAIPAATPYCMDALEVSRGEFLDFTNAVEGQLGTFPWPVICGTPVSVKPTCMFPPTTAYQRSLPASCMRWCSAWAFCYHHGKRLCGLAGGGNVRAYLNDPSKDEWFRACSGGGSTQYPYGGTYDPAACAGTDRTPWGLAPVGTLPSCEGKYPGLFDLSGNVSEWTDSCDLASNLCLARGGSVNEGSTQLICASYENIEPTFTGSTRGLRCCK